MNNIFSYIGGRQRNTGFTLIELLVALSIFSLVMVIIVTSLLTMVDANRKGQAISSVMNNLHFALESMTRNARTGTSYLCGASYPPAASDCPSGNTVFGYTAADGKGVYYRFTSTYIDRCTHAAGGNCNAGPWIRMTAPEINITNGKFYLVGTAPYPNLVQPRVIVVLQGDATIAGNQSTFNIQTTVVQRTPDR